MPKTLYTGTQSIKGEHINGYLLLSTDVFISERTTPISNGFSAILYGSEPREGGGLMLTPDEHKSIIDEGVQFVQYTRKAIGSEEFINGIERYCIWITDDKVEHAQESSFIRKRLEYVSQYRQTSKRVETRKYSQKPHAFTNCTYKDGNAIIFLLVM